MILFWLALFAISVIIGTYLYGTTKTERRKTWKFIGKVGLCLAVALAILALLIGFGNNLQGL